MSKTSTIMLVKNRALGDSIMGLSAVQYLKDISPESNIIYAVPQWIAPLYANSLISADTIYPLKLGTLNDILKLFNDIKKLKISHIHEMHQSGRGAKIFKWISFLLGIRYTAHNHHIKTKTMVIDQGLIKPLIQRDLDGVYSFMGTGKVPSYLNYPPQIKPIEKSSKKPLVILGVVATRETKMWPLQNYIKLAAILEKSFPQYKIVIPLSKSNDDKKIKEKLLSFGFSKNVEIVEWSLMDLPAAFSEAVLYIGNDTGLKHLAAAVGVKTFTFFGPEPVNEWHPYDFKIHPYFYLEGLACRTRIHHYCGLNVCDLKVDNMKCLIHFTPEKVFSEIQSYM